MADHCDWWGMLWLIGRVIVGFFIVEHCYLCALVGCLFTQL